MIIPDERDLTEIMPICSEAGNIYVNNNSIMSNLRPGA
jgi:hypothetical protein